MISFIKFIHILFALGLLGSTIYCMVSIGQTKLVTIRFDKNILILSLLAIITGTLLVHPKHWTFHTPWIQAAYLLMLIYSLGIFSLLQLKKKNLTPNKWIVKLAYLILTLLLIFVVHDAVTKTTFLTF